MFEDLVPSRAVRPGGRARALPFSVAFHGLAVAAVLVLPQLATDLPPVKAAPPPPIPTFQPVRVDVTPPPPTLQPRPVTRRAPESAPRTEPAAQPSSGTGPALPANLSSLGEGEPTSDAPALCFSNCTGEGTGAILPGPPDSEGGGEGDATTPRRAGRDVTPPAKLGGNPPVYPELAKKVRLEGDVVIECTIDTSGRVVNAVILQSIPLLNDAAIEAVRTWRYRPTLLNGVPVPVLMTVTVRFRIR
jgi:protein TonB